MRRVWTVVIPVLLSVNAAASSRTASIALEDVAPMLYRAPDGTPSGFVGDVMREAARRQHIQLFWRYFASGEPIEIMSGRKVDIIPATTRSPFEGGRYYVTSPWWRSELALAVRSDSPVYNLQQLAGKAIITSYFLQPTAIGAFPASRILVGPHNTSGIVPMCAGSADAVFIDRIALDRLLLDRRRDCVGIPLRVLPTPAATIELSIVSQPESRAVADALRRGIDELAVDGSLAAIALRYPPVSSASASLIAAALEARYARLRFRLAGAGALALIIAGLAAIYRLRRDLQTLKSWQAKELAFKDRERQLSRDLARQVEELQKAVTEKGVLLREVQHRVKNNLQVISSLASLQSRQAANADTRQAILAMQARVKSMSLIHEGLCFSDVLAEIDFSKYVQGLASRLIQSFAADPGAIRLHLDVEAKLRLDEATPCGLIVNELLSNALKHAFPDSRAGEIWIYFRERNGKFALEVRDNGIGMPAGFSVDTSNSLGLQVVTDLAAQLGGRFSWANDGGSVFRMTFHRRDPGKMTAETAEGGVA